MPPTVLVAVTVAPLPLVVSQVEALARALNAWKEPPGELWPVVRALLEDALDPLAVVDWSRPIHVLLAADGAGRVRWAVGLPAARPRRALGELAARCGGLVGPDRAGAPRAAASTPGWVRLRGQGQGIVPCRYLLRAEGGGLVLGVGGVPTGREMAWLRRRLSVPGASPGAAAPSAAAAASGATAPHPLVQVRLAVPALLARARLTDQKVSQYISLAGVAVAMGGGDAGAGPTLVRFLTDLWHKVRSVREARVALDATAQEIRWNMEIVGKPGGDLMRWSRAFAPAPLQIPAAGEGRTVLALRLSGRRPREPAAARRPAARSAGSRGPAGSSGGGNGSAAQSGGAAAHSRGGSAAEALLSLALARIGKPLRGAVKVLVAELLLGPGELQIHLGREASRGAWEVGITRQRQGAAEAASRILGALETVLAALLPKGAGELQQRRGPSGGWVSFPAVGSRAVAPSWYLRSLAQAGRVQIAVAGQGECLALRVGPGAAAAARLAASAPGSCRALELPSSHAGARAERISGELLLFAARLAATADRVSPPGSAGLRNDASAPVPRSAMSQARPSARARTVAQPARLAWGSRPGRGAAFVELRLPVQAIRAMGQAIKRLLTASSAGGEAAAGWSAWLSGAGKQDEGEDAL